MTKTLEIFENAKFSGYAYQGKTSAQYDFSGEESDAIEKALSLYDETIEALENLINLYVANKGTDYEFIRCITPRHANSMTKKERAECKIWSTFDNARKILDKGK